MPPLSLQAGSRTIIIRRVDAEEIIPLRHCILRAGLPIEEAYFTGDADPRTRHVAAFDGPRAVCCATFVLNSWEQEPAWQLRGMATEAPWRRHGLGQAVLQYAMDLVLESSPPTRLFWCNARAPALEFYVRQGWEVRSELFHIPTAGPHRKMTRRA